MPYAKMNPQATSTIPILAQPCTIIYQEELGQENSSVEDNHQFDGSNKLVTL
jgi:hypothetical protein